MGKFFKLSFLKDLLSTFLLAMLGCMGIVFTVLYLETFSAGIIRQYYATLSSVSVGLISIFTVVCIAYAKKSESLIYKIFFLSVATVFVVMTSLYILEKSGFLDKVDSVDEFRRFISGFGSRAVVIFVLIQFLQVVILPIPAFITVGAGVLLFGAFRGALLSCVGIILGSLVAYCLGRGFGVKLIKWLLGQKTLRNGLEMIKGKDKVLLTFMFLFPFFPDDVLCFVAGVTSVGPKFFVLMIVVTRIISVFASSYSINNSLIPYDTWWGILLWTLFLIVIIALTLIIYKKGDKIESLVFTRRKNIANH